MNGLDWRYSWGGRVRHYVNPVSGISLCGQRRVMPRGWYGAGSRVEREFIAAYPACKHCAKAAEGIEVAR